VSPTPGTVDGNHSAGYGNREHETKLSGSKASNAQGRSNVSGQTRASSLDASALTKAVPVVVQTMPSPLRLLDLGDKNSISGEILNDPTKNDGTKSDETKNNATISSTSGVDSAIDQRPPRFSDSPAFTGDTQSNAVPLGRVQAPPTPGPDENIGTKDFSTDALSVAGDVIRAHGTAASTSAADLTARPEAINKSILPVALSDALSKDAAPAEQPVDTSYGIPANIATSDTGETGVVASLTLGLSDAPVSTSKTHLQSPPIPPNDVPHVRGENNDTHPSEATAKSQTPESFSIPVTDISATLVSPIPIPGNIELDNSRGTPLKSGPNQTKVSMAQDTLNNSQAQPAAKSESLESFSVPITDVSATFVSRIPMPGNMEPGTPLKAASDRTKVSTTQESAGTTRKSIESNAGVKTQPRKDDLASSANSEEADQKGTGPIKASEVSPSFPVAGNQPLTTSDGKNASAGLSPNASDPRSGAFGQESTGVKQSPTQPETQTYPTSLINSAKLVERVGEAELRLGMQAGEFGRVDIRTSMVRNQFSAEISVERGELGRVMAADLPSLQNRLTDYRLPTVNLTIQNHPGSSTGAEQQKRQDEQRAYSTNSVSSRDEGPIAPLVAWEGTAAASRLDIHI